MGYYEIRCVGTGTWHVVFHGIAGESLPWSFRTEAEAEAFVRRQL